MGHKPERKPTSKTPDAMTADEYQKLALRTESPRVIGGLNKNFSRILHGAVGICTEAGELQDAIKKHLFYGCELDLSNVVEEIGDVLWYCALVLDACEVPLSRAMKRNINKLIVRYPERFAKELSENRQLGRERMALGGKK